jgi:hypothetical protein
VCPPTSDFEDSHPYSKVNGLYKLISGQGYSATVKGYRLYTKLLRINRESREVALRFYRVYIPCYLQTHMEGWGRSTATMLYVNPEHEIIHLDYSSGSQSLPFIDFIHDIKAYDPLDIGLINLALDTNSMIVLHSLAYIPEPLARDSLVTMLANLQELIWLAHSHAGRGVMGLLEGFEGSDFRFNHSMPVKPIMPSFTLLEQDSRPVTSDLHKVWTIVSDPRENRVKWRWFLNKWQVRQVRPTRERVLFAYQPLLHKQQVYDHWTAKVWRKKK